jgi:hypothetical protein
VRRHRKAASADAGVGVSHRWLLGFICAAIVTAFAFPAATPALAGTATDRPLLFTFDGSDSTAGKFASPNALDIDQAGGTVYVIDQGRNVLDKFSLTGAAQDFSATGSSSLSPGFEFNFVSDVAVDNSGVNPGRIHVMRENGPVKAFSAAGEALWEKGGFADVCGLAVDSSGHPWVGDYTNHLARQYATTGSPPAEIGSLSTGPENLCRLDFDANGNAYANVYFEAVDKYEGGVKVSRLDSGSVNGVTVDQSSAGGHVFTMHGQSFNEYDATGNLLGSYGSGTIVGGSGIAYDPALDRVYVSDSGAGTVEVFGAAVTGTVPDVAIEATTGVGVNKASFHGKVNPQSVANSYHFEWKQGTEDSWGGAQSSPPIALPKDSADHAVSFDTTGLGGGRTYQVRLVGTNTDNGLRAVSAADTFTTPPASAAPSVSIDAPSALTSTTATITGAIDSHEDLTTWNVQLSEDPTCAAGFGDKPVETIPGGHTTPDQVAFDLTELFPGQHYCVRITATNSAGTTTSETKQFRTVAIAPSEVETAPAAPVLDTSARLNAHVNPHSEDLTYHFEYSADGGSTWQALPNQVDTSGSRTQKMIAQQLTGLQPSTTYTYRVVVENPAGSDQGQELSFSTRSTAEATLPVRGYELVNTPDKGNQHVEFAASELGDPLITEDGEKALWKVPGGAPGGSNGTGAIFLAERSPSGWHSRSAVPPAATQVGEGELQYKLLTRSADMSQLIFKVVRSTFLGTARRSTIVRLDSQGNQKVLQQYEGNIPNANGDITADGSHVLLVDTGHRLADIGGGSTELVSVMPDGALASCALTGGSSFPAAVDSGTQSGVSLNWAPGYHLIDRTDASLVYFEASPNGSCSSPQGIYVRDRDAEETTLIDPGAGGREPLLVRATPDGEHAYFVTASKLDPADANSGLDIYRWDQPAQQAVCLTCVVPDAAVGEGNVGSELARRILISDDFSHIYFASTRQLVPGKGIAGQPNLYVLANGSLQLAATIEPELNYESARLSTTGDALVFMGTPNQNATVDPVASSCCRELYRFQVSDGSLECLSCSRSGTTTSGVVLPFAMAPDGKTVAFKTDETLVKEDVNRSADIYEWHNGVRGLITNGVTTYQKEFSSPAPAAISANGRDIFFRVIDPTLTGYERDPFLNLYDARIGGGFERPTPAVHCAEESCQGPLQAPPGQQIPGSSSFTGKGDERGPVRKRCAKGKVRRRNRCVAKHAHKSHRKRAGKGNRGGSK